MSSKFGYEFVFSFLLLLILPMPSSAKTIKVPLDKSTIQGAIDTAQDGDVIRVHSGTYFENIDFHGKAISVIAERGLKPVVIDGSSRESVVTFASGEGQTSVLSGFTIKNGRSGFDTSGFGDGGGIRIDNSSPTIKFNTIKNNKACSGAGISIDFGSPVIQGNRIVNNAQSGCSGGIGGGGISIGGAAKAQILDNVIANNRMNSADGGGISLFAAGTPTIRGNIIRANTATGLSPCASGGGIGMVNYSDATIVQNLITGNTAGCGGGIYWLVPFDGRGPFLVNNTIADNVGVGVFADGYDAGSRIVNNLIVAVAGETALFCGDSNDNNSPIIRFNDIFSPDGDAYGGRCTNQTGINGNLSVDPLFSSVATNDYHIRQTSAAIDAGDDKVVALQSIDFDGAKRIQDGNLDGFSVVDMGIYEFVPAEGITLTESSPIDDADVRELIIADSQSQSRKQSYKIGSGSGVTAITYDNAGHIISYSDVSGTKHKYTSGK